MSSRPYLKVGTVRCPNDKEPLEWEQYAGMRLKKEVDGKLLYQARCAKCGYYWGVHAQ